MTAPHKESELVFLCGRSRGKGNAEELLGKSGTNTPKHESIHEPKHEPKHEPIGVTDDYPAYRNLFKQHQLCWAHPLRKLRDLKESPSLTPMQRKHCLKTYESFSLLYVQLRNLLQEENAQWKISKIWREEAMNEARQRLQKNFVKMATSHSQDPKKLQTYKTSLIKNMEDYFTCLS